MTQYEMIVTYLTALAGRFRDDERGIGVAETIVLTGFALVGAAAVAVILWSQAQGRRQRRRRAGAAGPVASAGSWQRCCSGSAETIEAGSPPRSSCSRCSPSSPSCSCRRCSGNATATSPPRRPTGRRARSPCTTPGRAAAQGDLESDLRSLGLRNISVSVSRGDDVTVVEVSGDAPGILIGTSVRVHARSVTPTDRFDAP